jgi:ATP-dependent DNA helicase DinG
MTLATARRHMVDTSRGILTMQGRVKPQDGEDPEDYEARKTRILENTVAYASADKLGHFTLACAPVNLGGLAKAYFKGIKSVIITSATLAAAGSFDHIVDTVGVTPTKTEILPTTFDYEAQGFAYVPKDLPYRTRQADDYAEIMERKVQRAIDLCRLSQGGAFVLTTANDELDMFASRLKREFPGRVFAQGHSRTGWDGDPATILAQYLKTPNAILVGSKSFWEGVDVAGERLRLVIIPKLPFPIFGDPIVRARERLAGDAAFQKVQLVDMLTDLRQGVGRLIRSRTDRGVVALLDSRVWEKRYGKQVRAALQFPVTSDFAQCERYLPRFVTYFQKLKLQSGETP